MNDLPVHKVNVSALPASGQTLELVAKAGELEKIAVYLDVMSLHSLSANLRLTRWRRDGIKVVGTFAASMTQQCVITLEPVETRLKERFEALFLPEGSKLAEPQHTGEREIVLDPDGPDSPENFSGDSLDIWSIVLEHLLLAIDPFIRASGVELPDAILPETTMLDDDDEVAKAAKSPFAVLQTLKNPKNH